MKNVRFQWSESNQGAPVDHYVMEVKKSLDGDLQGVRFVDSIFGNSNVIEVEYGFEYFVRVAGVSAGGIRGPWSIWSVVFTPEALPGD